MKIKILLLAIWIMVSAGAAQAQSGGNFQITQSVIASGGQQSAGGTIQVSGTTGQTAAGTNSSGGNFGLVGGFQALQPLAPTAAQVSVGGRVLTATGGGIRNVRVSLTAPDGAVRTAQTNSFGYYRFETVPVGETYIISVNSKRFTFSQPTIIRAVFDEISDLDFIAFDQ